MEIKMSFRTISIAVAVGVSPSLMADVTTSIYSSSTSYSYYLEHMPDFDQIRNGLAADNNGDPGGMYCVPTTCADLLTYMSTHGEPLVGLPFADWENEEDYQNTTDFIDLLGSLMGTSGTTGTDMLAAYTVLSVYVWAGTGGRYTTELEIWTPWNVVTLQEMAIAGISENAIQAVCYGRYEHVGWTSGGKRVIWRIGGHCMAFTGAERSGSDRHIWAMDPDDSMNAARQKDFEVKDWDVRWMGDVKVAPTVFLSGLAPVQGMSRIMRGSPDFRLIDTRIAIRPVGLTSWGAFEGEGEDEAATIYTQAWAMSQGEFAVASATTAPFNPWKLFKTPSGSAVVLEKAPGRPVSAWFEIKEGDSSRMAHAESLDDFDFRDATFSKDRSLLVLGKNGTLYSFSDFDGALEDDNLVGDIEGRVLMEGLQDFDLLAHNSESGSTAFLDRTGRTMFVADRYFEETRTVNIPGNVPLGSPNDEGLLDFKLGPDGTAYLMMPDSNGLWMVKDQPNARGELLGTLYAEELRGFDLDDRGNILINDKGTVRCFTFTEEGLIETGSEGSVFAGQQAKYGLAIDRSNSNYDPRHHQTEGWQKNLDDEPCEDACEENPADLDGNGEVDGADLALLLGDWGEADSAADIDNDGTVGGGDLAILLGSYGS